MLRLQLPIFQGPWNFEASSRRNDQSSSITEKENQSAISYSWLCNLHDQFLHTRKIRESASGQPIGNLMHTFGLCHDLVKTNCGGFGLWAVGSNAAIRRWLARRHDVAESVCMARHIKVAGGRTSFIWTRCRWDYIYARKSKDISEILPICRHLLQYLPHSTCHCPC